MKKEVLTGILSITGAALGGVTLGPAGAVIGGSLPGLFMGSDETVPPLPPMVDPNQQAMLDELSLKKAAIAKGITSEFSIGREIIQRAEATALDNVQKLTGGDVQGAVAVAGQVTQGAEDSVGKLVGATSQMEAPYTQMIGDLINRMSQRRLELGMVPYVQAQAQNTQNKNDKNQLISQILASPSVVKGVGDAGGRGVNLVERGIGWLRNGGYDRSVYGNYLGNTEDVILSK